MRTRIAKQFIHSVLYGIVLSALVFPFHTWAAMLVFDGPERVLPGQSFVVKLRLDAGDELINAAAGTITVSDEVKLNAIYLGESVIGFWAESPDERADVIPFSGIIPGGYGGSSGTILTFDVTTHSAGTGEIVVQDVSLLQSDGEGTEAAAGDVSYRVVITEQAPFLEDRYRRQEDVVPPEPFEIFIEQNSDLFGGNFFAVFEAQDKGAGVDYYEVQERRRRVVDETAWQLADSPYELSDQSRTSYLFVKAVDKAGNVRIEVYTPPHILQLRLFLLYGIVLAAILYYVARRYGTTNQKKR